MTSTDLQKFLAAIQSAHRVRRVDRAAVTTTAILQIIRRELRAWLDKDSADLAGVRAEVEAILRDEFNDVARQTVSEIRREDE